MLNKGTKFANNVTQTTGGNYAEFSNLNLLTNGGQTSTVTINGANSTPNRPSTLSFTDFRFEIPNGADINKINIVYVDKAEGNGQFYIPAPTVTLLGVDGFSKQSTSAFPITTTHGVLWEHPNI